MKINKLFDIEYGQREYHSKTHLIKGNIPLISSSKKNNGVYGLFKISPKYNNVITVPNTGSNICEAIYHNYPCCIDDNCLVLKPKSDYSLKEILYFTLLIRKENKKYVAYGRQVTPERLGNTYIPDNLFPKWLNGIKENEILNNFLSNTNGFNESYINKKNEKTVTLDSLFNVYNGLSSNNVKRQIKKINSNFIPYIRPSNNQRTSIDAMVDKGLIDSKYIFPENTIYVSTDGQGSHTFSYVSIFEFVPNSNVSVLIPKRKMGIQEKIYYAFCITKNRYKFSYGRKPKGERLKSLLLPEFPPIFLNNDLLKEIMKNWKNLKNKTK